MNTKYGFLALSSVLLGQLSVFLDLSTDTSIWIWLPMACLAGGLAMHIGLRVRIK